MHAYTVEPGVKQVVSGRGFVLSASFSADSTYSISTIPYVTRLQIHDTVPLYIKVSRTRSTKAIVHSLQSSYMIINIQLYSQYLSITSVSTKDLATEYASFNMSTSTHITSASNALKAVLFCTWDIAWYKAPKPKTYILYPPMLLLSGSEWSPKWSASQITNSCYSFSGVICFNRQASTCSTFQIY